MKLQKALLAITLLTSLTSFAEKQGKEGGGGSQIESAFRIRAFELINKVKNNRAANKMCASDVMQEALETSEIKVVDQLVDLNTVVPVSDRSLDAWSRPGSIQLLKSAWLQYLPKENKFGSSVDALILHEVYRTTANCNDNTGAISTKVVSLLRSANTAPAAESKPVFSRTFSFSRLHSPGWLIDSKSEVCFELIEPSFIGHLSLAFRVYRCNEKNIFNYIVLERIISDEEVRKVYRMASMANAGTPLIIFFDLKTGDVAYGIDPSDMTRLP